MFMQTMGKPSDHSRSKTAGTKGKKNPIKVTYISSPVKVKASSASEFRAIVQELTGKNSDIVRDHSDDSYATVDLTEEANQVITHEAHQHTKNVKAINTDHEYLLDDAFSGHASSVVLDQLDDRFMWRDFYAENSFGFQSPYCLSLYD